jgi:hypothetical protein
LLEPYAVRGWNAWVSVGGLDASVSTGRGKRADVVGLPALFLDLDYRTGTHAIGDLNPTEDEAAVWIAAAPPATVTIHTAGGRHLYWVLDELLDWNSTEGADLLNRHKAFWMGLAAADSLSVDAAVLADPARVLRVAGTRNGNQGGLPVVLESSDGPTYSAAQLLGLYPQVEPPAKHARVDRAPRTVRAANEAGVVGEARVGDRFSLAVPVSLLAVEVFGADIDSNRGLTFPRDDGSLAPDSNARIFAQTVDAPEKMTIFGERVLRAFGNPDSHSWTAFDLAAHSINGGYTAAVRLLLGAEENGTWPVDVFDIIIANLAPSIADAFGVQVTDPRPQPVSIPIPQVQTVTTLIAPFDPYYDDDNDDNDDVGTLASVIRTGELAQLAAQPQTIATAIANRTAAVIPLEDGLTAHIWNGRRHGIYKKTKILVEGKWVEGEDQRITSWVAFKSLQVEQKSVDSKGIEVEVDVPKISVTIATKDGRIKTRAGFTVEQAHNPEFVMNAMNVGQMLPTSATESKQVRNTLAALGDVGSGGGTATISEYGTLGWLNATDGSGFVYLAPAASVDANGPTDRYTVGAPPKSDEGSQTEAQIAYGWPDIPQDATGIRKAAASVPAFLAITPDHHAGFALLGLMFAAPLALSGRGTVFLAALPGTGKTKLIGCAQAFLNGDSFGSEFTGGGIGTATFKGSLVATIWARHGVAIWDDSRVPKDDPTKAATMRSIVSGVLQNAYGGSDSGRKSNQSGGQGAVRSSDASAIMSGEALPEEEGILSRAISVEIGQGDIHLLPVGESPLDIFRADHSAGARAIYGAYIQWLAARLNKLGSLKAFRDDNARVRLSLTPAGGRSGDAASLLAVGWAMFTDFATEAGFADLLPSPNDVTRIVADLAGSNTELVKDSNPAQSVIRVARDMVAQGTGHFDLHDGSVPIRSQARTLGWVKGRSYDGTAAYEPTRFSVGVLTQDARWVVLRNNAVTEIKKRSGMASLPLAQVNAGFASIVMEGSTPGGRSPRELGLERVRGYVLPAEMFDLGSET